jgi:holin-like protein
MDSLRGLAWLLALQSLGEIVSRGLHLPVPGPVVGMGLLVLALQWEPVRRPVEVAAGFLLSHLSLLFVPVGVGVMSHWALVSQFGGRMLLVIVVSTWMGLGITAATLRRLDARRGPPDA